MITNMEWVTCARRLIYPCGWSNFQKSYGILARKLAIKGYQLSLARDIYIVDKKKSAPFSFISSTVNFNFLIF